MIILINAEEALDEIQYPLIIKTLNILGSLKYRIRMVLDIPFEDHGRGEMSPT